MLKRGKCEKCNCSLQPKWPCLYSTLLPQRTDVDATEAVNNSARRRSIHFATCSKKDKRARIAGLGKKLCAVVGPFRLRKPVSMDCTSWPSKKAGNLLAKQLTGYVGTCPAQSLSIASDFKGSLRFSPATKSDPGCNGSECISHATSKHIARSSENTCMIVLTPMLPKLFGKTNATASFV